MTLPRGDDERREEVGVRPTERVAYYRGRIVPESEVLVPFRDAGFVRADGAYDSARTFDGRVFRLREHLERLWRSLRYLAIEPPMTLDELAEISLEIARRNVEIVGSDVWVTQRVTRGVPREWGGDELPTVIVESLPIPFGSRAAGYREGVRVVTPGLRRTPPWALSPQAKTLDLLNLTLAAREARAVDPDGWPILTDENGNLSEGAGANIFAVIRGTLVTPDARYVLPGVTRDTVFELAAQLGIPVEQRDLDLFEAYTADELFITSTSLCICPVASVNGRRPTVHAIPGPVTARLQSAFSSLVGLDFVRQYLDHAGAAPERSGRPESAAW